jgi:hypothetical protein
MMAVLGRWGGFAYSEGLRASVRVLRLEKIVYMRRYPGEGMELFVSETEIDTFVDVFFGSKVPR